MPVNHEIYWKFHQMNIQMGWVNEYVGKYVKDVIKDKIYAVTGECKKCGIGDATLTLTDGHAISTAQSYQRIFLGIILMKSVLRVKRKSI